jgi:hypothetical protein
LYDVFFILQSLESIQVELTVFFETRADECPRPISKVKDLVRIWGVEEEMVDDASMKECLSFFWNLFCGQGPFLFENTNSMELDCDTCSWPKNLENWVCEVDFGNLNLSLSNGQASTSSD